MRLHISKRDKTEIKIWIVFILFLALLTVVWAINFPEPVQAFKIEPQQVLIIQGRQTYYHELESGKEIPNLSSRTTMSEQYEVTYYCSCEKCCDEWANNRKDGKVIGAGGVELIAGFSVAADLPFGSRLLIDGREYEVQDRGGAIKGKRIDIYCESHDEAIKLGRRTATVEIIELGE